MTLSDGNRVVGLWDRRLLASSVQGERDLYVSQPHTVGDGIFVPSPGSLGIWLRADDIKMVEWIIDEQEDGDANEETDISGDSQEA